MSIWFKDKLTPESLQPVGKNTMGEYLGIVFTEVGDNYVKATMPVDHRTIQPYGLLHGGASVALAETLGSIGAFLTIDPEKFICCRPGHQRQSYSRCKKRTGNWYCLPNTYWSNHAGLGNQDS
jgi:hypothetical protein